MSQGKPGVYDTIKTLNYVNGILSTYRTLDEHKKEELACKILLDEAMSQLTGTKSYQE